MEETKKKGTAGRKPSGIKYTTLMLPEQTRNRLRKVADHLEAKLGMKISLHLAIDWLIEARPHEIAIETPDGE